MEEVPQPPFYFKTFFNIHDLLIYSGYARSKSLVYWVVRYTTKRRLKNKQLKFQEDVIMQEIKPLCTGGLDYVQDDKVAI